MADREAVVEAGVAIAGAGLFVLIAILAGVLYGQKALSTTGALVLVGGIVVFIVGMSAIGYWLSER
ncbi:MAG: hypothetical protein ABEJ04_00140 [Halobacteriaceae archaeon]